MWWLPVWLFVASQAAATPEPHAAPSTSSPITRFHMRMHAGDLRRIERALLAGRLDEATTRALGLVQKVDEPELVRWREPARQVAEAALDLAYAPSLDEALRRAPRVAAACAGCHRAAQRTPAFPAVPAVPVDAPIASVRMARHLWATDRLWEGAIGPADDRWQLGLRVLAETPLPFTTRTDAPMLAAHLQEVARAQLAPGASQDAAARAAAYGEMLVTCAACHTSLHATPAAP
ncbi:MAG TPA: hypothetical protein VFP84_04340 [Kofleriaceae bacterium]|nr:hypothetical protein [Kofleriaceae bacterium]